LLIDLVVKRITLWITFRFFLQIASSQNGSTPQAISFPQIHAFLALAKVKSRTLRAARGFILDLTLANALLWFVFGGKKYH
jgi:hypothetical protein